MHLTSHLLAKAMLLASLSISAPVLFAQDTGDLPHAFDAGWKGEKTCDLLYETEVVRVGYCSFPPGIGHEKHFHHPHFGYVLEGGTLKITDSAGTVSKAQTVTGKTWSTDKTTIHEAVNVGDTTTSYLIVEPKTD